MAEAPFGPSAITGLVLAGGRGARMGGIDKGWADYHGRPLVAVVVERFAPQVGGLLLSANRNLDRYATLGAVVSDRDAGVTVDDYPGPLVGLLAGLRHARSEWVACVPCDAPRLPLDLVATLAAAVARSGAPAAVARADGRMQPTFALVATRLQPALATAVESGERALHAWFTAIGAQIVDFTDGSVFRNINTPEPRVA